jgi:hypothetical protein
MLSSTQRTSNYQNSRPNFGNISYGVAVDLIKAAKLNNGSCTLQQVRELAELAKDNDLKWHVGKDITSGEKMVAVSAFNSLKNHFCLPMQTIRRNMNLFEAAKKVILGITSDGEKKLAEIEARLRKTPKSDFDLEKEIRNLAVELPD